MSLDFWWVILYQKSFGLGIELQSIVLGFLNLQLFICTATALTALLRTETICSLYKGSADFARYNHRSLKQEAPLLHCLD